MNAHPTRGLKHICTSCCTRFYDLGVLLALCPKCGLKIPPVRALAPRKRRISRDPIEKTSAFPAPIILNTQPKTRQVK